MSVKPLTHFQKDKEDLEEVSQELELVDEDEKVQYNHSTSSDRAQLRLA